MTAISLEMVLPGLIGFWIGYYALGSMILGIVFLMLGVILGATTGMIHLVRLTSSTSAAKRQRRKSSEKSLEKSSEDKSESPPKT